MVRRVDHVTCIKMWEICNIQRHEGTKPHGRQVEGKKVKLDGILKELGFHDVSLSFTAQDRVQFQAINVVIDVENL